MSLIKVVKHSKILNKKYFQNLDFFFMVKIDLEKSNLDHLKYQARYINLQNTTISFQNIHLIDKYYAFLLGAGNTVEEWMSTPIFSM